MCLRVQIRLSHYVLISYTELKEKSTELIPNSEVSYRP
jgi:hypothetical protein